MSRYARQIALSEIGVEGQARLAAAHVLVVGVGGLGAPVLSYLCGAGVGRITIADGDGVALSNLHRQTLFREGDIGQNKALVAASAMAALNRDVALCPVPNAVTPGNAADLLAGCDLVLDCADSFAVSYTLSDACQVAGIGLITASALGLSGYVGGVCGPAPTLRAVFPELPDRAATCANAGVLGPVVGTIGALQAQMALAAILSLEPSPFGQFVTLETGTFRFATFRFDNAPEPAGPLLRFIEGAAVGYGDFVVDLRDKSEAPNLFCPYAIRAQIDEFQTGRIMPHSGQRAVLACRTGLRAWRAARALQHHWTGPIALVALGDTSQQEGPLS